MTANARQVLDDALRLPLAEREQLAEKLVESLVTSLDPQIEKAHLRAVQERRAEYQAGRSVTVDGDEALKHIRAAIRR
jgi:4'-phosphopantetheinyl transferase EntD